MCEDEGGTSLLWLLLWLLLLLGMCEDEGGTSLLWLLLWLLLCEDDGGPSFRWISSTIIHTTLASTSKLMIQSTVADMIPPFL